MNLTDFSLGLQLLCSEECSCLLTDSSTTADPAHTTELEAKHITFKTRTSSFHLYSFTAL